MAQNHTDAEFATRWPIAQAFGWFMKTGEDGDLIAVPSQHFVGRGLRTERLHWKNFTVRVPLFFWHDECLPSGPNDILNRARFW